MKTKTFFILLVGFWGINVIFAQKTKIELKLPVNIKAAYTLNYNSNSKIMVPGQGPVEQKVTNKMEMVFSVVDKKADNFIINMVINKVDGEMDVMGQHIKYSSSDATENEYNKSYKKLTNKIIQAEITPSFELVGELKPITEGLSKKNCEDIFDQFNFLFMLYPKKEIQEKEKWEYKSNSDNKITAEGTLEKVDENFFYEQFKINFSSKENNLTLDGIGSATAEVHKQTGLPVSVLMTIPSKGSINSPAGSLNIDDNTTISVQLVQ